MGCVGWRKMRNTTESEKKKGVGRRECCNTSPSTESLTIKLWMWGSQLKKGSIAKDSDKSAKTVKGSGRKWKKFQSKGRERKRPLREDDGRLRECHFDTAEMPWSPQSWHWGGITWDTQQKGLPLSLTGGLGADQRVLLKTHTELRSPGESRLPTGNTLSLKSVGDSEVEGNSLRFL